ncbi:T9SS type A sorting domain-containing protein [Polaribacter sp. Asnod1-A03]|uniref:T9SS type A sorting domain-containing protein n=1 Tax=Polaribacter sp. Asnod1-A03 TaxID=3160581 RepID=UPI003862E3F1
MKIKITLLLFILCLSFQQFFAQIKVVGSEEFGRIFDLTYDANVPNKIYAVTSENHIVVSEDNGENWGILYTLTLGDGAVIKEMKLSSDANSLTFSAHLPNTTINAIMVYDITSGSIVKTFNLPNQEDLAYVTSYDFYNNDMNVLLVDTNYPVGFNKEGKTFYTADGGITWELIYYTNDYDTVFINKVAISPNNPDKIFLTRSNGSQGVNGGLFISEDAGRSFTEELRGVVLDPITFDPSDDQTIFLGTGIGFGNTIESLYKSTDGGSTFNMIDIRWTQSILNNITVIKFNKSNPSQLIVLEENEIAISEDGGNTFESIVYIDEDPNSYYYGLNASYNPQNEEEIIITSNYSSLFSEDRGMTLSRINNPYFSSTGNTIIFKDETNLNLYYGVQQGHIHKDLNTGIETSYNIESLNSFSNSSSTYLVDQFTPNRIFNFNSSFTGSSLEVSNDNGATYSTLSSLYINKLSAIATYPSDIETILAAFSGYEASETILKKINFTDMDKIEEVDIKLPFLDFINGILIDKNGKITISIGIEIYVSYDDGETWENSSKGLEILNETDLIFDIKQDKLNNNKIALATSKGVFISDDNGENWELKMNKQVNKVTFSTETSGIMIASTYNSVNSKFALHYSIDNGETWEIINNEQLLSISSYSSDFLFKEDAIITYINTSDLGLLEYTIDLSSLSTPDDLENDLSPITIYPNPTRNILNIEIKNASIVNVAVFSLAGNKVLEFNNKDKIDISNLSSGIYSLRIKGDNNNVIFKRIIKQ